MTQTNATCDAWSSRTLGFGCFTGRRGGRHGGRCAGSGAKDERCQGGQERGRKGRENCGEMSFDSSPTKDCPSAALFLYFMFWNFTNHFLSGFVRCFRGAGSTRAKRRERSYRTFLRLLHSERTNTSSLYFVFFAACRVASVNAPVLRATWLNSVSPAYNSSFTR